MNGASGPPLGEHGGCRRPWKLIVTDDPHQTLVQGNITHHASLLAAANAFAKSGAPYKQLIFDDGIEARELAKREQQFLEAVCDQLGLEVEEVEG